MLNEKIELLGKGLYKDIPDVLTLTSIPTASELEYVGSEDYDVTMLDKILPQAVVEKDANGKPFNFRNLLEIDYHWICRCLRILNYGPYHTTHTIYCTNCNSTSHGEYQVNLMTMECKPLPEGFQNEVTIPKDAFIDFEGEVKLKLPTIQQMLNAHKDKAFINEKGRVNNELARMCYSISSIKGKKGLNPVEVKLMIQKEFSPADYVLLKEEYTKLTDYGLRAGGFAQCPKCGSLEANFIALVDDRFFRPTVGDLRKWKQHRSAGKAEDVSGSETAAV